MMQQRQGQYMDTTFSSSCSNFAWSSQGRAEGHKHPVSMKLCSGGFVVTDGRKQHFAILDHGIDVHLRATGWMVRVRLWLEDPPPGGGGVTQLKNRPMQTRGNALQSQA